ncbi:hypothetical protein [Nonlabens sp. MB-3u-79]|jgi:hypothetical protein|uniref:hypothetical protein n=1 Tax=Nonlabens sp. MB-3u-79 TaxID=2058134 RepID=UPI0012FDB625|nr:hypothetical protein [Nonlabens sp. MB-3u-79]|tara:strand:- start:13534 stop:13692 length:159 start_codon:yes stop_codon:yes gene_type:complete
MNKYKETLGVDINKDVFDVPSNVTGQHQYKNDAFGVLAFAKARSIKGFASYL